MIDCHVTLNQTGNTVICAITRYSERSGLGCSNVMSRRRCGLTTETGMGGILRFQRRHTKPHSRLMRSGYEHVVARACIAALHTVSS